MSSEIDRSHLEADAAHRSVATEVILRNLVEALERRHTGLTDEVLAAVNTEFGRITPVDDGEADFVEGMKAATQAVLGKPLT